MALSRSLNVEMRGLAILVGHGQNEVAFTISAFQLPDKHAAVGSVNVQRTIEQLREVCLRVLDCVGHLGRIDKEVSTVRWQQSNRKTAQVCRQV